jgi:beta-lactamase class A
MSILPGRRGTAAPAFALLAILILAPLTPTRVGDAASSLRVEIPAPVAAIPATPVGDQLGWVLGMLNDGAENLGPIRTAEHFSGEFLDALPSKELIATIRDLSTALAPIGPARFEGVGDPYRAVVIITTDAIDDWRLTIGVDPLPPHQISEFYLAPVAYPAPLAVPPATWAELDSDLLALAREATFLAAEIDGGTCTPVHGLDEDEPLAIGSAFKLYVLGELADQIAHGQASWDETLAIQDELRSLPSGAMHLDPDGTTYPLLTYAQQMIAASDNTATDHLIDRLGRENVEAEMGAMGHATPEKNVPLLATREWFAFKVKLGLLATLGYLNADDAAQRAFLADSVDPAAATLEETDTLSWILPRRIQTIEWFASASDLCRALASLQERSNQPGLEAISGILSTDPGVVFDARVWSYVGYKGGYETGVLNHTWLLQRGDGRWFAMILTLNDPRAELDSQTATRLMIPAAALLAEA